MIISSSLLFVYFLQGKQAKSPQDLSIDAAMTRIGVAATTSVGPAYRLGTAPGTPSGYFTSASDGRM